MISNENCTKSLKKVYLFVESPTFIAHRRTTKSETKGTRHRMNMDKEAAGSKKRNSNFNVLLIAVIAQGLQSFSASTADLRQPCTRSKDLYVVSVFVNRAFGKLGFFQLANNSMVIENEMRGLNKRIKNRIKNK